MLKAVIFPEGLSPSVTRDFVPRYGRSFWLACNHNKWYVHNKSIMIGYRPALYKRKSPVPKQRTFMWNGDRMTSKICCSFMPLQSFIIET